MNEYAIFSDVLFVYNSVYYLAMDQIPNNSVPLDIFSSYDIQTAVLKGQPYVGNTLADGWEWLRKEPKWLRVRKSSYPHLYVIEAHLLDTGMMWFNCEFN